MLNKVTGLVFLINSNLNEIYSYFSNSLFTIKQTYLLLLSKIYQENKV